MRASVRLGKVERGKGEGMGVGRKSKFFSVPFLGDIPRLSLPPSVPYRYF